MASNFDSAVEISSAISLLVESLSNALIFFLDS